MQGASPARNKLAIPIGTSKGFPKGNSLEVLRLTLISKRFQIFFTISDECMILKEKNNNTNLLYILISYYTYRNDTIPFSIV